MQQLDPKDSLLQLARVIPCPLCQDNFDDAFSHHYSKNTGAPSKPIRLMVGLLIFKQLENLSDENRALQWKRNPYHPFFCGMKNFQLNTPCHSTDLIKFRNRIGQAGFEKIFQMSVALHGRAALQDNVNIDTTVQEKKITDTSARKNASNVKDVRR